MLAFPFHFLNNNHAMNVRPKNYAWPEFYDRVIDLTPVLASRGRAIARRFRPTATLIPQWMNVVRAVSSEGWGRIQYHTTIRGLLDTDQSVRAFFEGETEVLPEFYVATGASGAGAALRAPAGRRAEARSERVPQVPGLGCAAHGAVRSFRSLTHAPLRWVPPRNSKCSSTHQPLTLGRPPGGEMPQQELASKI